MNEMELLATFDQEMEKGHVACTLQYMENDFPPSFYGDLSLQHIGVIVCHRGTFRFICNGEEYRASEGETVFLTKGIHFHISERQSTCLYSLVFYRTDTIRDILGTTILSMKFYEIMHPTECKIWHTGHEEEITHYISLLGSISPHPCDAFSSNELTLLLLSFTYRLCHVYHVLSPDRQIANQNPKMEVYVQLLHLIQKHYMKERGVRFYAEQLCISPKYLSSVIKNLSGFTVQQLVFQAIIKQAIFYINNSDKSIKQISDLLHFPNASAFGTFFKKQTGVSPRHYKEASRQSAH